MAPGHDLGLGWQSRRDEFETLDQARDVLGGYIDHRYPNRPHSRLGYRTPPEVRQTWEDKRPAGPLP